MKEINKEKSVFYQFLKEVYTKTYLGEEKDFEDGLDRWIDSMTKEQIMYFADEALNLQLKEVYGY